MTNWFAGDPPRNGTYLVTTKSKRGKRMVAVRWWTRYLGWEKSGEVLAWTFLPAPWQGTKAYTFMTAPAMDEEHGFEAAIRERLKRQAEAVRKAAEENVGKNDGTKRKRHKAAGGGSAPDGVL